MSITIKYEDGYIYSLMIDDDEFFAEDENRVIVPIYALVKQDIRDFPRDCSIEICDSINDHLIITHNVPTTITLGIDGIYNVCFDECITRKYWDAPVGLKLYMKTKREIIQERNREIGDVSLDHYDDDGAYITMSYSYKVAEIDSLKELFEMIDQVYNEIEGATDMALGSPFEKLEDCKKESDFSIKILLPLFRKLGFANVKYNHGNREYGKDITFARRTEFDEYEYWGVQVKYGDVSGGATGDINELISQAHDAFIMPFYDIYTRRKATISKLIIAISGKFTNNAIDKIVDGITDYPLKNNIVFIDGEKVSTLMEKYRRF